MRKYKLQTPPPTSFPFPFPVPFPFPFPFPNHLALSLPHYHCLALVPLPPNAKLVGYHPESAGCWTAKLQGRRQSADLQSCLSFSFSLSLPKSLGLFPTLPPLPCLSRSHLRTPRSPAADRHTARTKIVAEKQIREAATAASQSYRHYTVKLTTAAT